MIALFPATALCIYLAQGERSGIDPHIYFEKMANQSWKFEKFDSKGNKKGTYLIKFQGENRSGNSLILFFVAQGEEELGSYKFDEIGVYDDDFGGYILKKLMKSGDRWKNFADDGSIEVLKYWTDSKGKSTVSVSMVKKGWKYKKIETYESSVGLISIEYFRITKKGEVFVERWKRVS